LQLRVRDSGRGLFTRARFLSDKATDRAIKQIASHRTRNCEQI